MLIELLLTILLYIVNAMFFLFPRGGTFPTAFTDGISTVWYYIRSFDFIIPVDAIVQCLGLAIAWIAFRIFWDLFHWIVKKIPFTGMK